MRRPLRFLAASLALTLSAALAACSQADADKPAETNPAATESESTTETGWPRTITHAAGTTEIPAEPLRIVSTSTSITGSLLAIGAPVVASGATTPSAMTDDRGFFTQWAQAATDANVEIAYPNLELDLDAIEAFEPDLIIGSANGGDSTLEAYAQLSDIAPTVLLDYGTPSWQELTESLAEATGREEAATTLLTDFDAWVAEQAATITLPEQPVTALVYMNADGAWTFGQDAPQAQLLTSLGFTYEQADQDLVTPESKDTGVPVLTVENMAEGLASANTLFVVPMGNPEAVANFSADPLLGNQPAVAGNRVYSLGMTSFRLDYYSAKQTVETVVEQFAK
jgi:iron complex transport system substrate-binding protein